MARSVLWLFLSLVVVACTDVELPAGIRGEPFKILDVERHYELSSELDRLNVPFEVDFKGFIHYLQEDEAEILGLKRRLEFGSKLDPNIIESMLLPNIAALNQYSAELSQKKIPHETISRDDGWYEITWSQIYGPHVDQIREATGLRRMRAIIDQSNRTVH